MRRARAKTARRATVTPPSLAPIRYRTWHSNFEIRERPARIEIYISHFFSSLRSPYPRAIGDDRTTREIHRLAAHTRSCAPVGVDSSFTEMLAVFTHPLRDLGRERIRSRPTDRLQPRTRCRSDDDRGWPVEAPRRHRSERSRLARTRRRDRSARSAPPRIAGRTLGYGIVLTAVRSSWMCAAFDAVWPGTIVGSVYAGSVLPSLV